MGSASLNPLFLFINQIVMVDFHCDIAASDSDNYPLYISRSQIPFGNAFFSFPNSIYLVPKFHLGMPSATLRVASQKELITIVFGEHSTRIVEEGIPKRSLGTRKVQIKRQDGILFRVEPVKTTSPFDVEGIDVNISTDEIVECIREGREGRNYASNNP